MNLQIKPGLPTPFGVTQQLEGINFAVFSEHPVTLCLHTPNKPVYKLKMEQTGKSWHLCLPELPDQTLYCYQVKKRLYLDPYCKQIASSKQWREKSEFHFGIPLPDQNFDWQGDKPLKLPLHDLVIYEMHVRGFTQDPSSGVKEPGTYLGVIEKIPYLKTLGINAVELLPIYEFDELALDNYWGYSPINFFSPMRRYGEIKAFKQLVKALHENGIEIILDVVYNHTGEGDQNGPHLSFKGFGNSTYYIMTPEGDYQNFSGCGNTFNTNHPVTQEFICKSLRYWVQEMHIDGFRFDLASVFYRGMNGEPLEKASMIEAISRDPVLADTKLIAEPWDCGGLYHVGQFPSRWQEWNGKFRDHIRRFIKGTDGEAGAFATRICGSQDLYDSPCNSINFITCHDGYSLADLVSYDNNSQDSWNCGIEGPTDNPQINALRERQMRNFLLVLFLSPGIPMLNMGDEYGHAKNGNNNTWQEDNRLNWFQWDTLDKKQMFFKFCSELIHFRQSNPEFRRSTFFKENEVQWDQVDWGEKSRFVAYKYGKFYIAYNAHFESRKIQLSQKRLIVDTADGTFHKKGVAIKKDHYSLKPYSALLAIEH